MGKMILNGKEYAGSGSEWHEYSTSEKVVGTWIDGKPIYEKTFVKNISISNSWTDAGENIPNGRCISAFALGATPTVAVVGEIRANGSVFLLNLRNYTSDIVSFTIQYTKTTDT